MLKFKAATCLKKCATESTKGWKVSGTNKLELEELLIIILVYGGLNSPNNRKSVCHFHIWS